MNNSFGFDKIGLWLSPDDCHIPQNAPLDSTIRTRIDHESGEEKYSYNQSYIDPEGLFIFDSNEKGTRILFNPSKPYHPYELCSNSSQLIERTDRVLDSIESIGISINRTEARINRLDITKNIHLEQPLMNYADALSLVKLPRAKRQAQYPSGFLSGNNTRALIIYDKSEESNLQEFGIARGELQLRKRDALKPIGWNYKDPELFKFSKVAFTQAMEKTFQIKTHELCQNNQLAISFDSCSQLWSNLKALHKRNTLQYLDQALSTFAIIEHIGIPEHLNFCRTTGMLSKNIERRRKELLNRAHLLNESGFTNAQTKGSISVKLLTEISKKLIAA